MIERRIQSHKGQNGRVCVVGGSDKFHGAPIFAALAAEATGVDLIYPIVPKLHSDVTKNASYNFICHFFQKDTLSKSDIPEIQKVISRSDVLLIGPGLGDKAASIQATAEIIVGCKVPVVVDADGLKSIAYMIRTNMKLPEKTILTPHIQEFTAMTMIKSAGIVDKELLRFWAKRLQSIILLKGASDLIFTPGGKTIVNEGGNPGLTVGGSGDALAGTIAGLIALGKSVFEATSLGSKMIKKAGDLLFKEKSYAFKTIDIIDKIPYILKSIK